MGLRTIRLPPLPDIIRSGPRRLARVHVSCWEFGDRLAPRVRRKQNLISLFNNDLYHLRVRASLAYHEICIRFTPVLLHGWRNDGEHVRRVPTARMLSTRRKRSRGGAPRPRGARPVLIRGGIQRFGGRRRVRIDVRAALHVLRVSSVTVETHFTRARGRRPAFFV